MVACPLEGEQEGGGQAWRVKRALCAFWTVGLDQAVIPRCALRPTASSVGGSGSTPDTAQQLPQLTHVEEWGQSFRRLGPQAPHPGVCPTQCRACLSATPPPPVLLDGASCRTFLRSTFRPFGPGSLVGVYASCPRPLTFPCFSRAFTGEQCVYGANRESLPALEFWEWVQWSALGGSEPIFPCWH